MEDTAADRNETEESLETTVTSSGRPKRKLKPRNYSDEFYMFDNHGKFLPANTPPKMGMRKTFATSTPVKQPGMRKQGKARKHKPVESPHSDNVDSSNVCDGISPVVKQTETSEIVLDASHSVKQKSHRRLSDTFTLVSKTDNQDSITKNNVIAQMAMENGLENTTEETENNSSEFMLVCETQENNRSDASFPEKEKSQSRRSRKKKPVLEEEETKILCSKTDTGSQSLKGSSKKRKLDNISLPKGSDVKEGSSKQASVNKNSLHKTVKRESKKRTVDISGEDSYLSENVINETQRAESCEVNKLHHENRHMLDADIANSVSEVGMVVEKSVSDENGPEEETSCNLSSSGKFVSRRKQSKGSGESNTSTLAHEVIMSTPHDTGITPATTKKQRGRSRKNMSTELQIESPKAASTPVIQTTVRRKLPVKNGVSEISATPVCDEPGVQSSPKSSTVYMSKDIHPQRNRTTNVDPHLQEEKQELQFESNAVSAPQKRPRGRRSKCVSQERIINNTLEATENHLTQVGSHNATSVHSQSQEVKDEMQCETSVATVSVKGQERPPICTPQDRTLNESLGETETDLTQVGNHNAASTDPQSQKTGEVQSESSLTPVIVKRGRGRRPKCPSQKITIQTPPKIMTTDITKVEGHGDTSVEPESLEVKDEERCEEKVVATTQKKRRGRPPVIVPVRRQSLPAPYPRSGNSAHTCYHCGHGENTPPAMLKHMMTQHSLMWSIEYPYGFDNPGLVFKKLGHIVCQKCSKSWNNAQYYKFHQMWCGREDEMATCDICGNTLRAMWLQQHLATHKREEKKHALANEQNLKWQQEQQAKNDSEEEEDAESGSAVKKCRRKAAKNAIKLMSSLRDGTDQEQASSGDSSVEGYSEDNSDDDDDDDDSDDDDDEASEQDEDMSGSEGKTEKVKRSKKSKVKKKEKKPEVQKVEKDTDSQTMNPDRNNIWVKACVYFPRMAPNRRLQLLQQMYDIQPEDKVFPGLCPKQADWKRLPGSETKQYLPVHKESVKFAFSSGKSKEMEGGEHSLKFAQTLSHNGTSYCYAGGAVRAVEWCPVPHKSSQGQFLAISADRTMEELPDVVTLADGPGLIQIWSAGSLVNTKQCTAAPVLQYAIAHDSGPIHSMSWCPRGCFDESADDGYLKRLGLLAVACSDGRVLIYSLPQPEGLEPESSSGEGDNEVPLFRPSPALVLVPNLRKGCGPCLSVAWQQGSEVKYIIAGYGQGVVYMWDISTTSPLLWVDPCTLRPTRCFSFHTAAVVSCAWSPVNPSVFVTVSFDFYNCLWNIDSPDQPFGIIKRLGHNMPRSVCWAGPIYNGFFTACEKLTGWDDTPVCYHGLSKSVLCSAHKYMSVQYHQACTWDVNYSPVYEAIVTCDAVGTVIFTLLPMRDMIFQKARKTSWRRSKSFTVELYHSKLIPRAQPSCTQPQTLPSANNVICQQNSTAENVISQQSSTTSNRNEDRNQSSVLDNVQSDTQSHVCVNFSQAVPVQLPSSSAKSDSTMLASSGPGHDMKCDQHNSASSTRVVSDSDSPVVGSVHVDDLSVTTNIPEHASIPDHADNNTNIDNKDTEMQPDTIVNSFGNSSTDSTLNADVTCTVTRNGLTVVNPTKSNRNACPVAVSGNVIPPENVLESSSACVDLDEDKLNTHSVEEAAHDTVLHFLNCEMKKPGLMPVRVKPHERPKIEVSRESNGNAVYKVRLNPNPSCCLWLASGGQSGIIRLDNLKRLV